MNASCHLCRSSLQNIELLHPHIFTLCCSKNQTICLNCLYNNFIFEEYLAGQMDLELFRCFNCRRYLDVRLVEQKRQMVKNMSREKEEEKRIASMKIDQEQINYYRSIHAKSQSIPLLHSENQLKQKTASIYQSQFKSYAPKQLKQSFSTSSTRLSSIKQFPHKQTLISQNKMQQQQTIKNTKQIQNQFSNLNIFDQTPTAPRKKSNQQFTTPTHKPNNIFWTTGSSSPIIEIPTTPMIKISSFENPYLRKNSDTTSFKRQFNKNCDERDYFDEQRQRRKRMMQQYTNQQFLISQSIKNNTFFASR